MNHDDNNPDLQAWIEPELEARLVAAVLGEASAFEEAELNRLAGEKPELAIFKRRIEAVHGLLGLAVRPEQAPLRLAPERREKILQTIGAPPPRPSSEDKNASVLLAFAEARRNRRQKWLWASSLAASLMFAAILAVSMKSSRPFRLFEKENRSIAVSLPVVDSYQHEALSNAESSVRQAAAASAPRMSEKEGAVVLSPFSVSKPSITFKLRRALTSPAQPAPSATTYGAARTDFSVIGPSGGGGPALELVQKEKQISLADTRRRAETQLSIGGGKGELAKLRAALPSLALADKKTFAAPRAPATALAKDLSLGDEIVALSPFEVSAHTDAGYMATNTLAGTRLNSSLSVRGFSQLLTGSRRKSASAFAPEPAEPSNVFLGDISTGDTKIFADSFLQKEIFTANPAMPDAEADLPVARPATKADESLRTEIATRAQPVSTFSLHVSDVSFRLAQAALARGETPDPERIRPEEFYNAFDYGDPSPTAAEKISSHIEQSAHPLLQQRNLVRIAMKVGSSGRGAGQPLHLTVLLDTSGSMERADRIASVQRALGVLASLLGANDRVTLIGFSRVPRLLVEQLPGNQAAQLAALAAATPFTGGTNLEEALKLAGELARRHRDPAAQNRIVLITDGAANLGNADPAQLSTMIEALRQQGIAFDACGVGTDGLDDTVLEALTRKGDGRYYVIDQPEDADAGFARQLAGAFRPAAENVKVQVRFNPARVGHYRLIGFEQHRLKEEDFRNDKVDAAELAAEEAAVALYQVEVLPQGEGELGEVFVRFRDAATGQMVERSWTMLHEPRARAFDRATPTMQLAGTAALLAEKLRGGDSAKLIDLADLTPVVNSLRGHYANDARVQQLMAMFEQMRRRSGK